LGSFADSKAVIERTTIARRAIVLGVSFIGLEVAAPYARAISKFMSWRWLMQWDSGAGIGKKSE